VRYVPAVLRPALAFALISGTVWAAGSAVASDLQTVAFEVTITGSQRTVVTGTRRSVDDLGCTVRRSDLDRQTLTFATRQPGRLVAVRGRASFARVFVNVAVTGTRRRTRMLSGPLPECEAPPDTTESSCRRSTFAGRVVVALPSFGAVRVSGVPARRSDTFRCSPRPARPRPFLVPAQGRFPAALVTDRTATRITLRGDARFTDTFESGARRVTTVSWTVTLRRAD
jgi:hypothetical protein